jgi:hypothetical protein
VSASPDANVPVPADAGRSPIGRALERRSAGEPSAYGRAGVSARLPAVQAAAVAAGGFAAGAAVVRLAIRRRQRALTHKRRGRSLARPRRRSLLLRRRPVRTERAGSGTVLEIVGSRSLLVDVHLLGTRPDR